MYVRTLRGFKVSRFARPAFASTIAHSADCCPVPLEIRPHVSAAFAAGLAYEPRLEIGEAPYLADCNSFRFAATALNLMRNVPICLSRACCSAPGGSLRAVSKSLAAVFSRSCILSPLHFAMQNTTGFGEAVSVRFRTPRPRREQCRAMRSRRSAKLRGASVPRLLFSANGKGRRQHRQVRPPLVVHHSDFDVLIPSHSRIGKLSGGTRISMLLGTPG